MAASIVIAVGLSTARLPHRDPPGLRAPATATAAFTASICGLHFTGMAGVSRQPIRCSQSSAPKSSSNDFNMS